jgi:predicted anti-sigma-YlaC factor YlaD
MSNCNQQLLSAYVDGELDLAGMAAVEEHVGSCADCAFELAEMRDLSNRIRRVEFDDITSDESRRIHEAMDFTEERSVLRLGGVIGVIAASILVVCGTWLAVLPTEQTPLGNSTNGGTTMSMANAEPWERMAVTLQADSSTSEDGSQYAADWMLQGLNNGGTGP